MFFKTSKPTNRTNNTAVDYTLLQAAYYTPINQIGILNIKEPKGLYMSVNDSTGFIVDHKGIKYTKSETASALFEYEVELVPTNETSLIDNNNGIKLEIVLINERDEIVRTIAPLEIYARQFSRDNQLIKTGAFLPVEVCVNSTIGLCILSNEGKIGVSRIMYKIRMYSDKSFMTIENIS